MKIKIKQANTRNAHLSSEDSVEFMQVSKTYFLLPYTTRIRLCTYLEKLKTMAN